MHPLWWGTNTHTQTHTHVFPCVLLPHVAVLQMPTWLGGRNGCWQPPSHPPLHRGERWLQRTVSSLQGQRFAVIGCWKACNTSDSDEEARDRNVLRHHAMPARTTCSPSSLHTPARRVLQNPGGGKHGAAASGYQELAVINPSAFKPARRQHCSSW